MAETRSKLAEELFQQAVDLPVEEREVFLQERCGADLHLRSEVATLLCHADEAPPAFLQGHPGAGTPQCPGSPISDPLIGAQVGGYRVVGVIATGGMGTVYEAMQEHPKRRVALKVVRTGLSSHSALRRFAHEAEILARLRHPGIAQVYEAASHGDSGGLPYFAMEYVPGAKTITRYASDRRLSTRQRLELFTKVCDAVHHGHQRGIIHRDLKPGNILVDESGQPKVIDFGVARATDADMTIATLQTDVGQLIGTLRYMSPEQCEGDAVEIDTRCDVYALGIVFYELLTGELPYDLTTTSPFEIPRVIREEEPRRPSAINRTLRGDVETIVLKALEKDRRRRYQSALDLGQEIHRYLNNAPIEAKRDRAWYVFRKMLSRHRIAVTALALIVLVTTASAIGLGLMYRTADEQRSRAERSAEAMRRSAYFNTIALARNALESANVVQLNELLDRCPNDLRGWEWHYFKRRSDTSLMTLRGHSGPVKAAVSSDSYTIASAGWDKTIKLWSAATGAELQTLTAGEHSSECVAFSRDGRLLASGSRGDPTFRVWDVGAGEIRHSVRAHRGDVCHAVFSPDGRTIASSGHGGIIRLWTVDTGELLRELHGHKSHAVGAVAWSPDGQHVAAGSFDGELRLWSAETGEAQLTLAGHRGQVWQIAYSPDGRILASAGDDNTLRLWDSETGELLETIDRDTDYLRAIAFSPDDRRIAASTSCALRVWDLATLQQESVRLGHVDTVSTVAFTPDGTRIVTASKDTSLKIWDAAPHEEPPTLRGHEHWVRDVAVSPDGRLIASASSDQTVRLWDARSRTALMVLRGHSGSVEAVAFSPDGLHLASGGDDETVRVWGTETGETVHVLQGHRAGIRRVAWSPATAARARIASASWDGTVKLWSPVDGDSLLDIEAHERGAMSVAFSPDGTRVVTTAYGPVVRMWDVESGVQILELDAHADKVNEAAFSPDSRLIAAACHDRVVRAWDANSGELIHELRGHLDLVQCVAFLPDSSAPGRLVSAGYGNLIKIWDVETGTPILTLRGHVAGIPGLAFSPDSQYFVTASNDRTLKIWNAGAGTTNVSARPSGAKTHWHVGRP